MRPILPSFRIGLVFLLVGCETGSVSNVTDSTPDYTYEDTKSTDDLVTPKNNFGTQVGSEGFWGCEVVDRLAMAGTDPVPDTTETATDAASALRGAWNLQVLLTDDKETEGLLQVSTSATFFTVVTAAPCADYVEVELQGALMRQGDESVAMAGIMALSADDRGLRLHGNAASDQAVVSWGEAPTAEQTNLRIDATETPAGLSGGLTWTDCQGTSCDTVDEIGVFEAVR